MSCLNIPALRRHNVIYLRESEIWNLRESAKMNELHLAFSAISRYKI